MIRTFRARAIRTPFHAVPALCGGGLAAIALLAALWLAAPPGAAAQVWSPAPDAPFAWTRFDAEYSFATGKVYFLGGRLPQGAAPDTDGSIWSWDPITGNYADTGIDMPAPVSNYSIARLVDTSGVEALVTFGGRATGGGVVNTVQAYYPATNSTATFSSDPLPISTSPGGVDVVDGIAYVFGGFDATVMTADTFIFDIAAADGFRWTTGPALGAASAYHGTAVVDGVLYAIGGDTWDGTTLFARATVEKLDTTQPVLAWDDAGVADLPVACDEMRAYGFDSDSGYTLAGQIVVAGCGQWPNEIAESLLYDVATNTWDQTFPDLNQARRNHAGAFLPNGPGAGGLPGLWIWGGRQGSDATLLATPEYYGIPPTPIIFLDGFETGTTERWSLSLP
ncbi:MAG: hypothetical protein F9K18_11890 [Thermoanaerobaculia bacterium]|nr:MAG: hypothetical protein F9K18_11890 [Thermoanaerobaculia bacterium]